MAINMQLKRSTTVGIDTINPVVDLTNVIGANTAGQTAQDLTNPNAIRFLHVNASNQLELLDEGTFRSTFDISTDPHNHPESGDVADYLSKVYVPDYDAGTVYEYGMYVYYSGVTLKYINSTPGSGHTPNYPAADSYWTFLSSGRYAMDDVLVNWKVPLSAGKIPAQYFPSFYSASMDFVGVSGNLSDDDAVPTNIRQLFESVVKPMDEWNVAKTYAEGDWVLDAGTVYEYINVTSSSGNLTSNTTYWAERLPSDYENYLDVKKGAFLLVSDDGFIGDWVCALQTDYLLPNQAFSLTDDPQDANWDELHVEAGDLVIFSHWTASGTDSGYYNLQFKVMNGQYGDATGGITARKGIVEISSANTADELGTSLTSNLVMNEAALKRVMKTNVYQIDMDGLPSGNLKYYNTSIGNVSGMATNDIALIGSGATKTIYRYNGSGWDSTFGTITLTSATFRVADNLISYDDGGIHYRRPSANGTFGEFICVLQSEFTTDCPGDLYFTETIAAAV